MRSWRLPDGQSVAKQPGSGNNPLDTVKAAYLGDRLEYAVAAAVGKALVIDAAVDAPHPVGAAVSAAFGRRVALIPDDG